MPIPSVGRKVWYFANNQQTEPHDATIIKVYHALAEDGTVAPAVEASPTNLLVADPDRGTLSLVTYCPLGSDSTPYSHYRWPVEVPAAPTPAPAAPAPAPSPL